MCSPSLVEIRPLWASGVLEDAAPLSVPFSVEPRLA